jgi:Aerobic-type carbon monoxide dehydrogenase, small subunit CoxS/CutS homologs
MAIRLTINQKSHTVNVAPETPLLWVLRDHLQMVGTKFGCGEGMCGACTVLIGGYPVRSCMTPVSAVADAPIVTIEGLSADGNHPLQRAWVELDVPQCGYCQAGQILTAAALLAHTPHPTDAEIDVAMSGNLCRCSSYTRIRAAIHEAAAHQTHPKTTASSGATR